MSKLAPDILQETEDFIAVNKPSGLLSIPDREGKEPSLKKWLEEKYGKVYVVHRIDRDTSGLIVFARHDQAHKQLSLLFEGRDIEKYYTGLVHGGFAHGQGNIQAAIAEHPARNGRMITHHKGKPSETDYSVLERLGPYSWLQFRIHTGRTHQIRVHMQHIGHPIVCDELYGDGKPLFMSSLKKDFKLSKNEIAERPLLARLALHSQRLKFVLNEQTVELEAPLPKDLRATLQQLRRLTK